MGGGPNYRTSRSQDPEVLVDPNSWRPSLNKILVGDKRDTDKDRERREFVISLQPKGDQEREGEM